MKFTASSQEDNSRPPANEHASNVHGMSTLSSPSADSTSPVQLVACYHSESNPVDCLPTTTSSADVVGRRRADQVERSRFGDIARRGRLFSKRPTLRLVGKSGECNVTSVGVSNRKRKYAADTFTSLIEMRWTYHVVLFATLYLATWLAFGLVYYAIAVVHDDINHTSSNESQPSSSPCISNVNDYPSAFLFSLETQSTIGYGVRVVNPVCEFAVIVVTAQTIVGFFVQMLSCGLFFGKLSRPKGRAKTLLFSRSAVVYQRSDGQYQLAFRVGDMRVNSHIVGSSIRALVVRSNLSDSEDCHTSPLHKQPLPLCIEDSGDIDDLFMVWPATIVHKIDECSPLWNISAERLVVEQFEIIVILEGTVESTGSSTQVLTSYLPTEIHWAHILTPLRVFLRDDGVYAVDYSTFHNTLPVESMPNCSAKTWNTSYSANCLNTNSDDQEISDALKMANFFQRGDSQNRVNERFEGTPDDVGSSKQIRINHDDTERRRELECRSRSPDYLCRERDCHDNSGVRRSKVMAKQNPGGNYNVMSRELLEQRMKTQSAIKTSTM